LKVHKVNRVYELAESKSFKRKAKHVGYF